MVNAPFHLSDEDILLFADSELPRGRAQQARTHLAACPACRFRAAELEGILADFGSLHRRSIDPQLLAATAPRAMLRARLAEKAAKRSWLRLAQPYAWLGLALLVTVIVTLYGRGWLTKPESVATLTVPDSRLTPGATRPISIGDVCSMPHEDVVRGVPGSLRDQVFREYGIANPRSQDYEIDYLIAPGLGGTEDMLNLWPEPAVSAAWNAHDKDALEERLHQMVCAGELDLPTAQKAIASDWISAYKKYISKTA